MNCRGAGFSSMAAPSHGLPGCCSGCSRPVLQLYPGASLILLSPVIFLHYFRNLSWLLRCPGCSECTLMLERTLAHVTQCHPHAQTLAPSGFSMTTFMKHSFEQYPIPIICSLSCRFACVWPTEPSMLFKDLREYRADCVLFYLSFN